MSELMTAAPQPAPTAQPSGEAKKQGAANIEVSDFARLLSSRKAPEPVADKPADSLPEAEKQETTTPAAEEAQAPEAEVKPEETEEKSEEPKEETDEVLSQETKLDPKLQEKIDKRIGKEVAKRKALEARLAELEAKQATPAEPEAPIVVTPTPSDPLAHIQTVADLEKHRMLAQETILWAEAELDREDFNEAPPTNGNRPLTRAEVRAIKANALRAEKIEIPAREKFLQAQAQHRQKAQESFTWLADKTSPEYVEAQAKLKEIPQLSYLPNRDYIIGLIVEGEKSLKAKSDSSGKKAAKVMPKAKPSSDQTVIGSSGGASRAPVSSQAAQAAEAATSAVLSGKKGVSQRDFAALLSIQSKLKNTR